MIKILVIGCGPHATHFYIPSILRMSASSGGFRLAGVVDIEPRRGPVVEELAERGADAPAWFVPPFDGDDLPAEASTVLDDLLSRGMFNAVVISTDPLHHLCYAKWAVSRGLPVLMDKPVTTSVGAALDLAAARRIAEDYDGLLALYRSRPEPHPPFVLCAHRRYHPGIIEARRIVSDVCAKTGCPVTHVHCAHADGQWRLPHEICTQLHHSYFQGHGKVSHSGFHFIDCVAEFWRDGLRAAGRAADDVEVFSAFVRPDGLSEQIGRLQYRSMFGAAEYDAACPEDDAELARRYAACGEVDASVTLSLRKNGIPFSMATLDLLHDSYSRRAWLAPDHDLYKGNGRVKHEDHSIQVGPFLNVRIQSYQSKDRHDVCLPSKDEEPGGNNHFELLVFRNERMIGGRSFERVPLREIGAARGFNADSLFITQVKERSIREWVDAIERPEATGKSLMSAFADHRAGAHLMSAIYESYALRRLGRNPIAYVPWDF